VVIIIDTATLQPDQIIVILIADLTMIITGLITTTETIITATTHIRMVNTRIIQMVREIEVTTTAGEEITEGRINKLEMYYK
jgi:hypothetical protein